MYKVIVILIFTFFSSNLIALEKVLVPDYVNKETKSPWNFYENFEDSKLHFEYVKKSRNISNSPNQMVFLATLVGVISVIAGLFTSLELNTSSGPTIIVVALILFIISLVPLEIKSHLQK